MGCLWSKLLWHYRSFNNTHVDVASQRLSSSVSSAIQILFLDVTCFIVENVLSHTYVLPKIELVQNLSV